MGTTVKLNEHAAALVPAGMQELSSTGKLRGCPANNWWWPAAISIGTRPQFYDDGPLLVEVHLPGFDGNLYDASLDVAFMRRLRDEQVFSDVEALVAQIARDVDQTIEIFKKFSPNASALLE